MATKVHTQEHCSDLVTGKWQNKVHTQELDGLLLMKRT